MQINNGKNNDFWKEQAKLLKWKKFPKKIFNNKLKNSSWFSDGNINLTSTLELHDKEKIAILFENELGEKKELTYELLNKRISKFASYLNEFVSAGEIVTIYLPLIPETIIAMLACARIGVTHNVVFSAFNKSSLENRIKDSSLLITTDISYHKGVREILKKIRPVKIKTIVLQRNKIKLKENEFQWKETDFSKPNFVNSNHELFHLYTSGSTGKPKKIVHSTGGYGVYVTKTTKDLFNFNKLWCTADIGWITGHSYNVYGPLLLGKTIFIYEGFFINKVYDLINKYQIESFYTSPTALRMIKKISKKTVLSLKQIGSVGEPLDSATEEFCNSFNIPIIDTWWQTELGGIIITNKNKQKGFCGSPLYSNIEVVNKKLFLTSSHPGIFISSDKYNSYFINEKYVSGDNAIIKNNQIKITGRSDDFINCSAHLISPTEMENIISKIKGVDEVAIVGMNDSIKGEVPVCFVKGKTTLKKIQKKIREQLSPFTPQRLFLIPDLPKTRSGKIMRRLLKKWINNEDLGDISSLSNPEVFDRFK